MQRAAHMKFSAQKRHCKLRLWISCCVQVKYPANWKVRGEKERKIKEILQGVLDEKKAGADKVGSESWYHKLSDDQIAKCSENPQLFVVQFCSLLMMPLQSCFCVPLAAWLLTTKQPYMATFHSRVACTAAS
jgi:hypothetical protein